MTTNVPQPTFGPTGFVIPAASAVLAGVILDIQQAFGSKLNLSISNPSSLSTPQGQLATSMAAAINQANQTFLLQTTQTDPAYAFGRWQDAIARIYFINRIGAQPTVLQIACVGLAGVVIPDSNTGGQAATIQDEDGNLYSCTTGGTIPAGGTITLPFANQVAGPIAVPSTNAVSIYQAIPGWDSVTVVSGVLGINTESRADFEARRAVTVAKNSFGAIGSIVGAVSDVSGVIDFWGYDNASSSPATVAGVTIKKNSVYISVVGGTDLAVAQAILAKKAPGCDMTGNTTVTAYDSNPLYVTPIAYQITFERPNPLQILFAVDIVPGATVPSNATALIQAAIINAFAGGDGGQRARIAEPILATRFIPPVAALGPWAQVRTLTIGSNNNRTAVFDGTIAGTALTVVRTDSGTIAIGQTISDANFDILPGTQIVSGSGSSWVVNISQTVAGASFTGTGSGTNLTVTAVTGTIEVGNNLAGTGVPAGTKILSQTSGPTGGAGVYVTSVATTASSAAITATKTISGALADQNTVTVNADQVPEVEANNITVTVA